MLMQQLVIYETSASELDIIRDISRTFPSHVFFQQKHGPGQRSLYNVLKAYSVFDRDVGYVQVWLLNVPLLVYLLCVWNWMILNWNAGNGLFSWSVASLYEWRGCLLVIGRVTQRSCPCSNGRVISGKLLCQEHLVRVISGKLLWVPVSSTGKVSYRRIRGLGSNPAYTKNQLVSWLDDKEQSSWSGRHRFNFYHFYIKKKG